MSAFFGALAALFAVLGLALLVLALPYRTEEDHAAAGMAFLLLIFSLALAAAVVVARALS